MFHLFRPIAFGLVVWILAGAPAPARGQDSRPGDTPLRIYGLGDMGKPGPTLNRSVALLAASVARQSSPDDAIVYLGDNFYPDGLQDRNEDRVQALIRGVMDDSGLRKVQAALTPGRVFAVAGNHEYYKLLLFGHFPLGFSEKGDTVRQRARELGWSYAGGRADVTYLKAPDGTRVGLFLLDSAVAVAGSPSRIKEVMDEFERHLKASAGQADWRVIAMHHPLVTRGDHGHSFDRAEEHGWFRRNSFPHKLDTCCKKFKRFATELDARIASSGVPVDLVMSGHDHNLQMIELRKRSALGPRVQVVSGSASKVHERTRRLDRGEYLASQSGFVELNVSRAGLGIVFHGDPGPCLLNSQRESGFSAFTVSRTGEPLGTIPCGGRPD